MKKLDGLLWIPKLIQAYSELQVQRAIKEYERTKNPEVLSNLMNTMNTNTEPKPPKKKVARQKKTAKTVKNMPVVKLDDAKLASKPELKTETPLRTEPKIVPQVHPKRYPYESILKELRDTKNKLNHLEKLESDITEMREQFDDQMKKILEKMENKPPNRGPHGQMPPGGRPPNPNEFF